MGGLTGGDISDYFYQLTDVFFTANNKCVNAIYRVGAILNKTLQSEFSAPAIHDLDKRSFSKLCG